MRYLPLRIAASLLTVAVVTQPHAGRAAIATATATQMPHISVTTTGTKGSPVILIPGLSSPRAVWDGAATELAKTNRVYLVQVNGFGGDDPRANTAPGVLDGVVADLHEYIARNRLTGAAVIGHSMGGLAALMLAKAHPGDAGKLMIVDSLPYIGDIFVPGATVAQIEPRARMIRAATVASYGTPVDTAQATANGLALKPESRTRVVGWIKQADPRVTGEALYEDMTTDLRPDMAGIATPITLVYPWSAALPREKADPFYHAEYAKAPHVTFAPIGDSAHFVMLDQPAAFQAAVERFVEVVAK